MLLTLLALACPFKYIVTNICTSRAEAVSTDKKSQQLQPSEEEKKQIENKRGNLFNVQLFGHLGACVQEREGVSGKRGQTPGDVGRTE